MICNHSINCRLISPILNSLQRFNQVWEFETNTFKENYVHENWKLKNHPLFNFLKIDLLFGSIIFLFSWNNEFDNKTEFRISISL